MLLAKLYLNAEVYTGTARYAEALAAAQAVDRRAVHPGSRSTGDIFLADNNTSPEIIFPVTQDGLTTQTLGGMTFLVHASCGGNMNAGELGVDGCWCGLRLKPEAYNPVPARTIPGPSVLLHRRAVGRRSPASATSPTGSRRPSSAT